jgi:hypothetical protein
MRGAINEMLAGLGLGTDPAEVLAEFGFSDVPPDAIASALVHYAETADLELADALAPIVTRVSDVPFEEGDLLPIDGDAPLPESADVFALLDEIGLGGRDLAAVVDDGADPDDFDDFDEVGDYFDELAETVSPSTQVDDDDEGEGESTYGAGNEIEELRVEDDDTGDTGDTDLGGSEVDELGTATETGLDAVEDALPEEIGSGLGALFEHNELGDDFDDDTDPSDLDLD